MADNPWEEVGQRFAELGRQIQQSWSETKQDQRAGDDIKDAGDKVRSALDDMADTINRAVGSSDVQDATRRATGSLSDALAGTLRQVAEWLDRTPTPHRDAPRDES